MLASVTPYAKNVDMAKKKWNIVARSRPWSYNKARMAPTTPKRLPKMDHTFLMP